MNNKKLCFYSKFRFIFYLLSFAMFTFNFSLTARNSLDIGTAKERILLAAEEKAEKAGAEVKIEEKTGEEVKQVGAEAVPSGQDLVNINFPELTDIKDIIKAVALWTNQNVLLDRNVAGKIQIISPRKVTKEEAYQAFLSALNMLGLTTVETGKIIKIMRINQAVKGNLKTYWGSSWASRTDEIITQIIPLKYVDAKKIQTTLSRIVSSNSMIAYEPTNTLIISDSGHKIHRVIQILKEIDVQTQQPKVMIIPIQFADPKNITRKVNQILKASSSGRSKSASSSYHTFKIIPDERTNSVIIVGPSRTIKDIKDLVKKFDVPLEDPSAHALFYVRPLDYADAKKLAATLSRLTSSTKRKSSLTRSSLLRSSKRSSTGASLASIADLGDGVKISADESSNSLLITGSINAYKALNAIIRKLDIRQSQVFIEADILDIQENNNLNLGTSIFAGWGKEDGKGAKGIVGWEAGAMAPIVVAGATTGEASQISSAENVAKAFSKNMTIGILSGEDVTVPGLGKFTPGLLIDLLKEDSNTRVISSPHILTANNHEASITVGETVFYRSSDTSVTGVAQPKVEKEPVDLTLNIKPNVSHSNYVTMKMQLDQNEIKGYGLGGLPQVSKRKTVQNVTVKNGQTVVVSGLITNRESETFKKIPLLGDIPILGWLFRNSSVSSTRSNLVIFLTPHIVHGAADLAKIYKIKIQERDDLLDAIYGDEYKDSDFYRQVPTRNDGKYRPTSIDKVEDAQLRKRQIEISKMLGHSPDADNNIQKKLRKEAEVQIPMNIRSSDETPSPVIEAGEDLESSERK